MTRSYHSSRSIATLFCLPFLLYASSDTKILFNMKRIVASEVKRYASTSTSKDIQRFSLCRFVLVFYCSVFIDDVQKTFVTLWSGLQPGIYCLSDLYIYSR